MLEIVMRLARTLASFERLRILSQLALCQEKSPSRLGAELHMSLSSLSGHLAKLSAAGLITRRRSGRWSYCQALSPYRPAALSGMAAAWLRSALSSPKRTLGECGGERLDGLSAQQAERRVHEIVFEAATAFTDLRRLQILRHLASTGETTIAAMCRELGMSRWAAHRQTKKLMRRGYLCVAAGAGRRRGSATAARESRRRGGDSSRSSGEDPVCRLARRPKTPIHAQLYGIIQLAGLRKEAHSP
jgi:DNA-binding transcriptional ArsR family regulator